jgi:hypothetical protein
MDVHAGRRIEPGQLTEESVVERFRLGGRSVEHAGCEQLDRPVRSLGLQPPGNGVDVGQPHPAEIYPGLRVRPLLHPEIGLMLQPGGHLVELGLQERVGFLVRGTKTDDSE